MQARELKPGRWFDVRGGRALCVWRGESYVGYVNRGCERVMLCGHGMEVEPLDIPEDCDDPWGWQRPAPVKQWRPFTESELRQQFLASVVDRDGGQFMITGVHGGNVLIGVDWLGADELLSGFWFLRDGNRCGVQE